MLDDPIDRYTLSRQTRKGFARLLPMQEDLILNAFGISRKLGADLPSEEQRKQNLSKLDFS